MHRFARRLGVLVVAGGLATGCPQYTTYGYQYRMQQQFTGGEEPEQAPVEARQLLAAAKTVAFFPPDVCVNTDPSISSRKLQELRANCGVLMSTLERAAEGAGYEVLSWQNLRGSKRAIDYAREANVDVLFEINEFQDDTLDDTQVQHTFAFFERGDGGNDTALQVATPVAQACVQYAFQADKPAAAAKTGTIDIKTVGVVDGRDRWHYRKTENVSLENDHPKVLFTAPRSEHPLTTALLITGGIALGVGAGLAIGEAVSTADPLSPGSSKFSSGGWSTNLIVIGVLAIAGGIAVHYELGGSKPEPARTLCDGHFAQPVVRVIAAPVTTLSSEHTFVESTGPKESSHNLTGIQQRMLAQFIQVLVDARASRPRPAPAPPAPPPPQP